MDRSGPWPADPHCQLEVPTHAGVFYPDLAWRLPDFPGHKGETRVLTEEYDGVAKYQARDDAVAARAYRGKATRSRPTLDGVFTEHRVAADVRAPLDLAHRMYARFPPRLVAPPRVIPRLHPPVQPGRACCS